MGASRPPSSIADTPVAAATRYAASGVGPARASGVSLQIFLLCLTSLAGLAGLIAAFAHLLNIAPLFLVVTAIIAVVADMAAAPPDSRGLHHLLRLIGSHVARRGRHARAS